MTSTAHQLRIVADGGDGAVEVDLGDLGLRRLDCGPLRVTRAWPVVEPVGLGEGQEPALAGGDLAPVEEAPALVALDAVIEHLVVALPPVAAEGAELLGQAGERAAGERRELVVEPLGHLGVEVKDGPGHLPHGERQEPPVGEVLELGVAHGASVEQQVPGGRLGRRRGGVGFGLEGAQAVDAHEESGLGQGRRPVLEGVEAGALERQEAGAVGEEAGRDEHGEAEQPAVAVVAVGQGSEDDGFGGHGSGRLLSRRRRRGSRRPTAGAGPVAPP
jgi:hypothetical protein